uniref:Uncharacterized protein n=1 Tax=Plectus sambesii TaxID=2011161 RepID=A0A914WP36_9BILA
MAITADDSGGAGGPVGYGNGRRRNCFLARCASNFARWRAPGTALIGRPSTSFPRSALFRTRPPPRRRRRRRLTHYHQLQQRGGASIDDCAQTTRDWRPVCCV